MGGSGAERRAAAGGRGSPGRRRDRYHHGDLRRTVLDGALEAIDQNGPAALSLREIARRAGVSHAAPAHHFGDKPGLLTAIAAEGFQRMADATRTALEDDGAFIDAGIAAVRFALTHRAHWAVMFRPELYRPDDPAVTMARGAAGQVLAGAVRDLLGVNATDEQVQGGVIAIWSFTHGFATLLLTGNFDETPDPDTAVRQVADSITRLVEAGAFDA